MNKPQRAILLLLTCLSILATDLKASPADVSIPATDEGLPGAGPIRRYDWFKKCVKVFEASGRSPKRPSLRDVGQLNIVNYTK